MKRVLGGMVVSWCMGGSALAASDLTTTITAPSAYVYEPATWSVRVNNIGNQTAQNVTVAIQLPATHTSPQVYVLGTLGSTSSSCTRTGTTLNCSLGSIAKRSNKTVTFTIAFPQNAEPLVVQAAAATTSAENSTSNNGASATAALDNYGGWIVAPAPMRNRLCTGTGLTSFYECTLFPSSLSSWDSVLLPGGDLEVVGEDPGVYTGYWEQIGATELTFEVYEFGTVVATFTGFGTGGGCFEGLTTFPGSSYVSPYEVCPR